MNTTNAGERKLTLAIEALRYYADPKNNAPGAIAREALAAIESELANAAPAGAELAEPERMTTDEAREYLVKFMERHFTDKTFHRYIRGQISPGGQLAGDFAWQMARALRSIAPAGVVPEGWKLVPVEMTQEMRVVGVKARGSSLASMEEIWKRVLDSAPAFGGGK